MIFTVNFKNSGVTKEMEFDEAPMVNDVLTIRDGGVDTQFHVIAVSGTMTDGKAQPSIMTVELVED